MLPTILKRSLQSSLRVGVRGFASSVPPSPPPLPAPTINPTTNLKETLFHDVHRRLGAKMTPFCGWDMPLQYPEGVLAEHHYTRNSCSVFDVSHMGQLKVHGALRAKFLDSLVVADVESISVGTSKLSVFTNEKGGIIDDTVITNAGNHLYQNGSTIEGGKECYVVINAACVEKDLAHLNKHLAAFNKANKSDVTIEDISMKNSLIAVQGPHAERLLAKFGAKDLIDMPFMTQKQSKIHDYHCLVTRCGYTGEDGFEISMPNKDAIPLLLTLTEGTSLDEHRIKPAGLGARDSLRLEAGLCLYGHDMNDETTPVEASLSWLIGKNKREKGGFPGADIILKHLKEGVTKKRVSIITRGAPAREGALIYTPAGEEIGVVTSGSFSPTLNYPIAMGYVKEPHTKVNTKLMVKVRGKEQEATVVKSPFVPHSYKKPAPKTPAQLAAEAEAKAKAAASRPSA